MSAGRKHRRSIARGRAEEDLRRAAEAPARHVGSFGGYDVVMKGPVMHLLQAPTPDMPAELADALARRRRATLEGVCECGGRLHLGPLRPGHVGRHAFMHEEDCTASDRAIEEIAERVGWERAS